MNAHTRSRPGRALVVLACSLLLCLLILAVGQLTQHAYSQGIDPPTAAEGVAPAATPTPVRQLCSSITPQPTNRPAVPGDHIRMIGDDEILLSYNFYWAPTTLQSLIIDNPVGGNSLTVSTPVTWTAQSALANFDFLTNAAADLNGDHKAELVSAMKNNSSYLEAFSWYVSGTGSAGDEWSTTDSDSMPSHEVDTAAGDIDGKHDNDEVVIAYRDKNADYRVTVLDGDSSGGIATANNTVMASYHDDAGEQGSSQYHAVATGDFDGDGANDDIVVAFRDSAKDLNVSILRYDGTSTLKEIWLWDNTENGRGDVADDCCSNYENIYPIDVAAGDLDGDFMDEVVVAARIGQPYWGEIQLIALDVTSTSPFTVDTSLWMNEDIRTDAYTAATTVSLAVADMDGDSSDEIALAFNRKIGDDWGKRRIDQGLFTYEYVPFNSPSFPTSCSGSTSKNACFKKRSGGFGTSDYDCGTCGFHEQRVQVAAGDIDRDNRAELAWVRFKRDTDDIELRVYDAESGLTQKSSWVTNLGTNRPAEFWISMGDRDGDSVWGDYVADSCWLLKEAHLQSVLFAPPHWPEGHPANNSGTAGSSLDSESLNAEGTTQEASVAIGGSVSSEKEIKGFTMSFARGWEKEAFSSQTKSTSTSYASKWSTCPKNAPDCSADPSYGGVAYTLVTSACYTYHDPTGTTGNVDVCLPWLKSDDAHSLNWWYTFGPAWYPETFTPVGINLAQGRMATQSSLDPGFPADPKLGVDGNPDGVYNNGSVAHTGAGFVLQGIVYPSYWQVDLGGEQWIGAVQLWNRTDSGYTGHLKDFYVFVSKTEFTTSDVNSLRKNTSVWKKYVSGEAGRATIVPVDTRGRYVRVQLFGPDASPGDAYGAGGAGISATMTTWLDLAELQVYGMPGAVDQWSNGTGPVTNADNTKFTIQWPYNGTQLSQTVTGKLLGKEPDTGSYRAVTPGSLARDMSLGFGEEGEVESGTSTSNSLTLGLAYRRARELTKTTSEKTSQIVSWSSSIGFWGTVPGLPTTLCPNPNDCNKSYNYEVAQYAWQQQYTSNQSFRQQFLVQGWWVPLMGSMVGAPPPAPGGAGPDVKPAAPLITSPTHPDPDVWVNSSTATANWSQPPGDPATVAGYNWELNQVPDTMPWEINYGLTTTKTRYNLADGVWYMHVRAVSSHGQWSDTAHRAIRVDTNAPRVALAIDPPEASGEDGWFITPATVTVTAGDGAGSGVANLEYSTDGTTWQPYTAPLVFGGDTAGTTVYARATDGAGLISEPVTTTLKIDRTAPDSHVTGGAGAGAYVAEVVTNALGNEELVLAGAVKDDASGISTMNIAYDGLDSFTVDVGAAQALPGLPGITANWSYRASHQIGAGYHIFTGSAQDGAGNEEAPYEMARVLWYPKDSPDLSGSSLIAAPTAIRPGDTVAFVVIARNAGWQEALVSVVDTLPAGLTPVFETLPADVTYDPAVGTLTWSAQRLWPGQAAEYHFQAQAAAGLPLTKLENKATLHAFWPNTDLLPADQRQKFLDKEQTVAVKAFVTVDPALSADADRLAPWVVLFPSGQQVKDGPEVTLTIPAAEDATRMYLREWTLHPVTGDWIIAQNSGWTPYAAATMWTLAAGQGVHYLAVWVADAAGNVSPLTELNLVPVNRMDAKQSLAAGERVQYRGSARQGEFVELVLTTLSGDPDMYAWTPRSADRPDVYTDAAAEPGQMEGIGYTEVQESSRFLIEVGAASPSEYTFDLQGLPEGIVRAAGAAAEKVRPDHPLTVSSPLSAGQAGTVAPLWHKTYLPVMLRNN